jgi:hypothetical protein
MLGTRVLDLFARGRIDSLADYKGPQKWYIVIKEYSPEPLGSRDSGKSERRSVMEGQAVIALVLGIAITLFVPALVWATVIAGLYQMVREKVRERRSRPKRHPLPTQVRW